MLIHCHTHFSLRYGIVAPGDVLQWAASIHQGQQRLPLLLADINNSSGLGDFFRVAQKYPNIRPIMGIDFCDGAQRRFLGIARTHHGFALLNRLLSFHSIENIPLPTQVHLSPFFTQSPAYLDVLEQCFFVYPLQRETPVEQLKSYEFIGVQPYELKKLRLSPVKRHTHKLLALCTSTFRNTTDFSTHRLLRCIANNCLLSMLPPNEVGHPENRYLTPEEIIERYADAPALIFNAQKLLDQCDFEFDFAKGKNKKTYTGDVEEDFRMMSDLAYEGMRYRYPKFNFEIKSRLEKEMKLIYELGFTSYFLINWDICRFAREQGFYYVGRGSGANSMAAYCLRITDVDPIDLDLYFERFINPYRSSPPDFDLDFSWQDRDTVTAYIMNKYGPDNAALLATYSTFQANAVVRELGKVFGLPKNEIDEMLDKKSHFSERNIEIATDQKVKPPKPSEKPVSQSRAGSRVYSNPAIMERNSLQPVVDEAARNGQNLESLYQKILRFAHRMHNMPNYRSIHAGGVLIPELPIYYYSALDMPPKGFQTVQFSMLEAEDMGLAKFDILSQRGLGHIKDAVGLVKQNRNEHIDIHRIQDFKKDAKIRRLIETGHTMGCFYVESPAMRQLLRKLKCNDYLTLVAASSVIRPGVARSGMMREYILRHVNPEARKRAHPVMLDIMPDTYGIMVYQEDVIKVAHHFAGLGLAESDVLRRGMSGKFRSREEFQGVKDRFFQLCNEKGHDPKLTAEVWHQVESFAGYSFAKGHSASYAVESYQSLYLKAHYPLEFYVGVINNFGGFYRTQFYVHAARMCGADVQAPCINNSLYLTSINQTKIYLGLVHVASLEQKLGQRIVKERLANGPYTSLHDFVERIGTGIEQLKILVRINAFRSIAQNKKTLMWEIHWLLNKKKPEPVTLKLFKEKPKEFTLPELDYNAIEDAFEQMELLGFPLCSPFDLVDRMQSPKVGVEAARKMQPGKVCSIEGYLVTVKPTRTVKGEEMNFGTWIDSTGHFFDSIHFPPQLRAWPFKGRGVYSMRGMVTEEFGVVSLEVDRMEKLPWVKDPRWE